jgi:hypothetical protein
MKSIFSWLSYANAISTLAADIRSDVQRYLNFIESSSSWLSYTKAIHGFRSTLAADLAKSELKVLQREVQKSRSDVQRYLNLGWIGVCDTLAARDLGMDNLMDLWQKFHPFLLLLQYFCLKLEKLLALWEKVLYLLLLYLSFSEFPNRLRPLCTTMPWTIWPALVVLWGVCWMFYDSWDWGDQGKLPTAGSTTRLFEDIDNIDLYEGDCTPFHFFSI